MARPRPSRYTSSTRPFAPPSSAPAPVPATSAATTNTAQLGARPRPAMPAAWTSTAPPSTSRRPKRSVREPPPNDPDM